MQNENTKNEKDTCQWTCPKEFDYDDGILEIGCTGTRMVMTGDLEFIFCPYCGKKIAPILPPCSE